MADASEGRLVRVSHVDAATAAAIMTPAGGDDDAVVAAATAAAAADGDGGGAAAPGTCEGVFVAGVCTITPRARFCCRYYTGDDSDAFNGGLEPDRQRGGYTQAQARLQGAADAPADAAGARAMGGTPGDEEGGAPQGAAAGAAAAAARLASAESYGYARAGGRRHGYSCWTAGGY
jgi:hypothetical protein